MLKKVIIFFSIIIMLVIMGFSIHSIYVNSLKMHVIGTWMISDTNSDDLTYTQKYIITKNNIKNQIINVDGSENVYYFGQYKIKLGNRISWPNSDETEYYELIYNYREDTLYRIENKQKTSKYTKVVNKVN